MRQNLDLTHGLILAEAVMMHLGQFIGRQQAHEVVYAACAEAMADGQSLSTALAATPEVTAHLDPATLQALLDPANYLGVAPLLIDHITG